MWYEITSKRQWHPQTSMTETLEFGNGQEISHLSLSWVSLLLHAGVYIMW